MFTSRGWIACLGVWAALISIGCGGENKGAPGAGGGTAPSIGGSSGTAGTGEPEGGAGGDGPVANPCDDNVLCTLDEMVDGNCFHTPQHFQCLGGSYCSLTEGCARGDACAKDDDCERPDTCVTVSCDPKTARCAFKYLDTDGDGEAPLVCAGKDCNDAEFWVHSDAPETCDGLDNDCDGVVDPAKESGCLNGESCVDASCKCDGATSSCKTGPDDENRVCVDLKADAENCGVCGRECPALETCTGGLCDCEKPLQRCGFASAGTDLSVDRFNCGACDVTCGNAACEDGACQCPVDTVNCGTAQAFDCRDTDNDADHCGACAAPCSGGSGCRSAACDAEVASVRMYGAAHPGTPQYGAVLPMTADAQGNLFVGVRSWGVPQYELPNGSTPVWGGWGGVAKLDSQANVLWSVPSNTYVGAIAAAGDDVWAAFGITSSELTVGNETFTPKADHQSVVALVKLKGSTGEVLQREQFDLKVQPGGYLALAADATGAWLAFDTPGDVAHGATSFTRPDGYVSLLYATNGASRWLPGTVHQIEVESNDKLSVSIVSYAGVNVTLGGEPFTVTNRFGQWAFARYAKNLTHEASHLMPATFEPGAMTMGDSSVFSLHGPDGLLQENKLDGSLVEGVGAGPFPFYISWAKLAFGKIFAYGGTNDVGGIYAGRRLARRQALLLKFDAETKALENSMTFEADLDPATSAYIGGLVVTEGGESVMLAMSFDHRVAATGGTHYEALGASGIAFMKIDLPKP